MTDEQVETPIEDKPKKKAGRPFGAKDTIKRSKRTSNRIDSKKSKQYLKNLLKHSDNLFEKDETGAFIKDEDGRKQFLYVGVNTVFDRTKIVFLFQEFIQQVKTYPNIVSPYQLFKDIPISYQYFTKTVLPKFSGDAEIEDLAVKVDELFHANIIETGQTSKTGATFSQFMLRSKFDYNDKQIVEHQTVNFTLVSDSRKQMLQDIANRLALTPPKEQDNIIEVEAETIQ